MPPSPRHLGNAGRNQVVRLYGGGGVCDLVILRICSVLLLENIYLPIFLFHLLVFFVLQQAVNQFLQASINDQRQHISRATDLLLKYEK